jgi:hypothetical protein
VLFRSLAIVAICVSVLAVRASAAGDEILKDEIGEQADALLAQLRDQKFAELEALEAELRGSKARFAGGGWKLYYFYDALSGGRISTNAAINSDWLEIIGLLKAWRAASPNSGVPSLLLADAYTGYGWFARGTGRAATVSQARFDIFHDRVNQGAFFLTESRRLLPGNPQWFTTSLLIARASQWPKDRAYALFKQAMAVEPAYQHNHSMMAVFLLPRWFGEPGEWERFADESTGRVDGAAGSAIYNHIVLAVADTTGSKAFFEEYTVNWRKIQWSFADRERLYGADRRTVNAMCQLAGGINDKEMARRLMERIGDQWEQSVWRTRKRFDEYQEWLKTETEPR